MVQWLSITYSQRKIGHLYQFEVQWFTFAHFGPNRLYLAYQDFQWFNMVCFWWNNQSHNTVRCSDFITYSGINNKYRIMVMCSSNWPCPTTLPGKVWDITSNCCPTCRDITSNCGPTGGDITHYWRGKKWCPHPCPGGWWGTANLNHT